MEADQQSATQVKNPEPANLDRWNWGAFLLSTTWAIEMGDKRSRGLADLFSTTYGHFYYGKQGLRIAWESNDWASVDQFNRFIRTYDRACLWIFLALPALIVFGLVGFKFFPAPAYSDSNNPLYIAFSGPVICLIVAFAFTRKARKMQPPQRFSSEHLEL
jgi:hypothetical protein